MSENQACRNQFRQCTAEGGGRTFKLLSWELIDWQRRLSHLLSDTSVCLPSPVGVPAAGRSQGTRYSFVLPSVYHLSLSYNPVGWIIFSGVLSLPSLTIPFLTHHISSFFCLTAFTVGCPRLVGNSHSFDSSSLHSSFLNFFPWLHLSREQHGLPFILCSCWFDSLPPSTVP